MLKVKKRKKIKQLTRPSERKRKYGKDEVDLVALREILKSPGIINKLPVRK